jgi:hypothetical protein
MDALIMFGIVSLCALAAATIFVLTCDKPRRKR